MVVLSKLKIPDTVIQWLAFVPAAVLAAIITPAVLLPENRLAVSYHNIYLLAALPAFAIAFKTRSLVWTLIGGMLAMALLQSVAFI